MITRNSHGRHAGQLRNGHPARRPDADDPAVPAAAQLAGQLEPSSERSSCVAHRCRRGDPGAVRRAGYAVAGKPRVSLTERRANRTDAINSAAFSENLCPGGGPRPPGPGIGGRQRGRGRLAFPRLSGAEIYESAGVGNPLLDHVSYFRLGSPTTWFISAQLFPDLLEKSVPTMRQWAHYLNQRAWRVRRFTANLGLLVLTVYVFDRLAPGGRGFHELTAQMRDPGWTFAVFLGLTVLAPVLGLVYGLVFARAMTNHPMELPPPTRTISARRRMIIFWAWRFMQNPASLTHLRRSGT